MELILTSLLRRFTLSPWWAINMFNQSINLKQLIFESDFWIRWRFYSRGNLTSWEGETSLREIGLCLWKQGQGGNIRLFLSGNASCPLNRFFSNCFFNFQNCESMWHINRQTNVRKGVLFKYCPFPLVQDTTYFTRQNTMGQRCLNQVWAINSDCSARATCNKPFSGIPQLLTFHVTLQKAPKTWKFSCHVPAPETWHITKTWQVGHPWKRQFRKVYFKSLEPKPD